MEFLGHVVGDNAILPSFVLAAKKFPIPTNVKHVQSFLGLTSYFRKSIPCYAKIAKPLSDLLRKNGSFTFSHEQEKAFESLRAY